MSTFQTIRQRIFGLHEKEASFAVRGFFSASPLKQERLEQIGRTFIFGYNTALAATAPERIEDAIGTLPKQRRSFAFEGAAMALGLQDLLTLTPWSGSRWRSLLEGAGAAHIYLLYVGFGWAMRRSPLPPWRLFGALDPLLRWLAYDGYGFHEGYFCPERFVRRQAAPTRLRSYELRAFDQGLGRSLWFVDGADVHRIAADVNAFSAERRPDLWSGVGLAVAFAGGASPGDFLELRREAGRHAEHVRQGVAFAAEAHSRAGSVPEHTEESCRELCGCSSTELVQLVNNERTSLPQTVESGGELYEVWRERIRDRIHV